MKKYLFVILPLMLLPAAAMAEMKIGVVQVERLFNEYVKMTGVDDKLQARFAQPKKELEDMARDIEAQEKDIKKNELLVPESKTKKAKEDLLDKVRQYREKEAALGKDVQAVRNQELSAFREVVMGVTQKMAKEEKYTLILQSDGVMFVEDGYNVTDKILKKLKAELPAKK
jgi:outer membrane protein